MEQNRKPISLTGIFLLSILAACQPSSTDTTSADSAVRVQKDTVAPVFAIDSVLIAGESAGKIKLGADAAVIYESMGKPDAGDAAMQKAVSIWYHNHDSESHETAIYTVRDTGTNPPARIMQIRSTDPGYKTAENIGVSSTLTEISKAYSVQKLEDYPADKSTALYDDVQGIAFEIDSKERCVAILLHPKGEAIETTYLPLR